jgi:HD superfamily phosphodiesterase
MKISDIYQKYKIPQMLQLHQLRVAGVASIICDNFNQKVDKQTIISVGLLHDMGNIVKYNFDYPDEFFAPEGKEYWKGVQKESIQKYGDNDNEANLKIVKEMNAPREVVQIVSNMAFVKLDQILVSKMTELKINEYSDLRVAPSGVLSLENRLLEGRERYLHRHKFSHWQNKEVFKRLFNMALKLEKQIFKYCRIKPEGITDDTVNPLIESLRSFEIDIG